MRCIKHILTSFFVAAFRFLHVRQLDLIALLHVISATGLTQFTVQTLHGITMSIQQIRHITSGAFTTRRDTTVHALLAERLEFSRLRPTLQCFVVYDLRLGCTRIGGGGSGINLIEFCVCVKMVGMKLETVDIQRGKHKNKREKTIFFTIN